MVPEFKKGLSGIPCILVNLSSLDKKIVKENRKTEPDQGKINVWEIEKRKVQSALDKRRVMA